MPALLETAYPESSAEFAAVDTERVTEVAKRHQLIAEFLEREGYAALVLQQPANLAWLTAGADLTRGCSQSPTAALFVTPEARVVVCGSADTAEVFEHHIPGLGFQLKERPWSELRSVMLADLCRGRRVASDAPLANATDVSVHLPSLRTPLPDYDLHHLREAGRRVAHAVEATARAIPRGRTELEVAGELAHRLLKHQIEPFRLQILADGRGKRFRHWHYGDFPIQRFATISVVGQYRGLHVGCARTVSLGAPPDQVLHAFQQAAFVHASGLFFSQVDWAFHEIWNRIQRIYEKTGATDEWRQAEQASVCEYDYGNVRLIPSSEYRLSAGVPVHWHPSVGPIACGDTVIATHRGAEILTRPTDWPLVSISVKGTEVQIPAILILESAGQRPAPGAD